MPSAVRFLLVLGVAAVGVACTTSRAVPRPAPLQRTDFAQEEAPRDPWGKRLLVEAMVIPAAWLERDYDRVAPAGEAPDGWGYGLRAAVANQDQSIGMLYQGFHTDDDTLDVQTVGLDFDTRMPFEDGTPLFLRAGGGIGLAWLDTADDESLGTELALQGRIGIDFEPANGVVLGTSLGGILFGHPGETEAYGVFVTIGVTLVF